MKVGSHITRKSYNSFVASDGVQEVATFSLRNDYNMYVFLGRDVWRVIVVPPTSSHERIQVVSCDNMRSAMNHAFSVFARDYNIGTVQKLGKV